MPIVTASAYFVSADRLPVRPVSMSAGVAFTAFALSESGGLIAEDGGTPLYYVTAEFLFAGIYVVAEEIGMPCASIMPVSTYLLRILSKKSPICQKISEMIRGVDVVPVLQKYLRTDDLEPERQESSRVVAVRGSAGQLEGWFFTDKLVMDTVQTSPPVFRCKKWGHPNDGPDHNICRECGGPIY